MKRYKPGQEMITTCRINGVEPGATVVLLQYRPLGWSKAERLTGMEPKATISAKDKQTKPEHWVARFIDGTVRKTRMNTTGDLPQKTFIVFKHMVKEPE